MVEDMDWFIANIHLLRYLSIYKEQYAFQVCTLKTDKPIGQKNKHILYNIIYNLLAYSLWFMINVKL